MSDEQQNNISKKGDIIINPNTHRPIKVGSRTWLGLVKLGLVSGDYIDPQKLEDVPEQYYDDNNYVEQKIETINKTLPSGKQAVRGRGKYKNKIVSRSKNPTTTEISRYTAQIASRAVKNNIDVLADSDDIETLLEKMIMEQMTTPIVRGKIRKPKKQTPPDIHDGEQYEAAEVSVSQSDDENDYEFNENDFD